LISSNLATRRRISSVPAWFSSVLLRRVQHMQS
jgi:hypothetical protein